MSERDKAALMKLLSEDDLIMHPALGQIVDDEPVVVVDSIEVEARVPVRVARKYCDFCSHVESHARGCPEERRQQLEMEEARDLMADELEKKNNPSIRAQVRRFGALLFRALADKIEGE